MLLLNLKTKNNMSKQLIFQDKYVQKLKNDLNVDLYKGNEFIYDKKQVLMMPNIDAASGLPHQLDAKDDCKTAILVYESFQKLEPIQASDGRLWVYLAH